ncbi:MAG: type II toxin-antitoxin system VapC family toxin [Gemmatimonadetes bacterium]|nr:type II toxin-antitoxin system VapC family toxin [Gemmatimonadota bacterium]
MILCDVNVLLYALRSDSDRHDEYRSWLIERLDGPENIGVSELVLSGVVRIATHPRVYRKPSAPSEAFAFADAIRSRPNAVMVAPGQRHWDVFRDLCDGSGAKGNLIPDAYFAALAIEWGCEWVTTDRDYARFPGLKWRHPLE